MKRKPHSEEAWAVRIDYWAGGISDFGGSVLAFRRRKEARRQAGLVYAYLNASGVEAATTRVVRVRITEIVPKRKAKR